MTEHGRANRTGARSVPAIKNNLLLSINCRLYSSMMILFALPGLDPRYRKAVYRPASGRKNLMQRLLNQPIHGRCRVIPYTFPPPHCSGSISPASKSEVPFSNSGHYGSEKKQSVGRGTGSPPLATAHFLPGHRRRGLPDGVSRRAAPSARDTGARFRCLRANISLDGLSRPTLAKLDASSVGFHELQWHQLRGRTPDGSVLSS